MTQPPNTLSDIAHKLRTPLTVIMAAANNLLDGAFGPLNAQQSLWLRKLQGHTETLERLLNEILESLRSEMESGKLVSPTGSPAPMPTAPAPSRRDPAAPTSARILLVDDDQDVIDVLQDGLSGKGFEILTASTGDEAFAAARSANPDLILMDVHLGQENGIEVCSRIKAALERPTPVILVTGQADLRQLSASDAADDLLMKPFHIHELLVRVRSMLKMKALMDEIARRP